MTKMIKKSDFYYDLPEELIAQTPVEPRDSSRLMVYNKQQDVLEHKVFTDVINYLQKGDLLVVNNTKVYPARIYAKGQFGGKMELLLLKRINLTDWESLVKPGKRAKIGATFSVSEELSFTVIDHAPEGGRIIRFNFNGVFEDILSRVGEMPLPPYIRQKLQNKSRYNTVYCKKEGSSAAPTAGLHFTTELLQKIKDKGVQIAEVELNVGLGTFRPVKEDDLTNHVMHTESYSIDKQNADLINSVKASGGRIIAVGTTSVRTLETVADQNGFVKECSGDTSIFIYPPYKFKCVDCLITNFHLPESTLIMLVSALLGREKTLELYKTAVDNRYRFFSFGDACFFE